MKNYLKVAPLYERTQELTALESSYFVLGVATRAEVSTLKNAKLCKIGVECVEFM